MIQEFAFIILFGKLENKIPGNQLPGIPNDL